MRVYYSKKMIRQLFLPSAYTLMESITLRNIRYYTGTRMEGNFIAVKITHYAGFKTDFTAVLSLSVCFFSKYLEPNFDNVYSVKKLRL